MSWIDVIENKKFEIKTGDGKVFTPLWKNGEKTITFNTAKFDFINQENSLIDRKKTQSAKFPLVFWFQGVNNIDDANDFELSARDSRLWTVEHPFYGTIKGQPISLTRNDKNYNVTEVTVEFWESITDEIPLTEISIKDEVNKRVNIVNVLARTFVDAKATPEVSDVENLQNITEVTSSKFVAAVETFNEVKNKVNKAVAAADKLVDDAETAIVAVQDVINFPAEFSNALKK